MTTRMLVIVSAAIEAATGIALIGVPDFVARLLLGVELSAGGVAVARVAGFALLALGVGCWPDGSDATLQATRALFLYNLCAGLYLGYLRVGGGFIGYLLWPACALHVVLGALLVRGALDSNRSFPKQ
jgi:hypothetical protein